MQSKATEPMRDDIRLLDAILGDTVREQNGEAVYDLVERARVESFRGAAPKSNVPSWPHYSTGSTSTKPEPVHAAKC